MLTNPPDPQTFTSMCPKSQFHVFLLVGAFSVIVKPSFQALMGSSRSTTGRLRSKCQQGGARHRHRAPGRYAYKYTPVSTFQHLQCRHWPGRGPATHVTMMPMIMTFTRESTDKIRQISTYLII